MVEQGDAEVLQRGYEAFNRGVQSGDLVPWIEEFLDTEVEWRLAEEQPDARTEVFRGHEGIRRLFDRWLDAWEEWALVPEEFIEAGDAWVVLDRIRGRGRASGVKMEMPYAHVFKLRSGKVVEARDFSTREEALHSVGLPESSAGR